MPTHLVFFLFTLSFLSGVAYASLGLALLLALIPAAILASVLYAMDTDLRVALCTGVLVVAGSAYYYTDEYRYEAAIARVPQSGEVRGVVVSDPKHEADFQSFTLRTTFGKLSVITDPDPTYSYGDALSVEGKVLAPSSYERAQHTLGEMRKPQIRREGRSVGNPVLASLFTIKRSVQTQYQQLLSPEQANFLYGIIFGANEGFSPSFAKNLETSGLRFITAIDGLHMQIVILILFTLAASLVSRRIAFVFTFAFVACFIALTGFTVSGIRASLMAFIAGLARQTGRMYLPHNILALAALVLVFINPKVLLFDVGFQLSFLAVIAIVYLLPALRTLLHLSLDEGFLGWKESLLIVFSVQLATAPIVIAQFQTFSLTSFVASVLVVWMLPFIIIGGFLTALFSFILYPLAFLASFLVAPMIEYVIVIVNLFARFSILFNPAFGFVDIAAYYSLLVGFLYWHSLRQREVPSEKKKEVPPTVPISEEAARFEIVEID